VTTVLAPHVLLEAGNGAADEGADVQPDLGREHFGRRRLAELHWQMGTGAWRNFLLGKNFLVDEKKIF